MSQYLVLARKYRPQAFEEVVGQEHVAQTLKNAILQNRVAHGYLFSGSRGVGKTSMARIFAKALNCPHGKEAEPCNRCEICVSISQGSCLDVVEIDGASHRGVEDVEVLREGAKYIPSKCRYKIYIIDEVHMLTRHAFNALLKTLEEPPEHVKFILATTEPHKVPDTILSRVQRFDFRRIRPADMVRRLRQILEEEGREGEEAALQMIAEAARGGMRDAQSLLDQAMAFCEGPITAEEVSQILGILPPKRLATFLESLLERNPQRVLQFVDDIYWQGVDLLEFVRQVLENLRLLLRRTVLPSEEGELALSEEVMAKASPDDLLLFLQVLTQARERMSREDHPRLTLEMALVYLCRLPQWMLPRQWVQGAGGTGVDGTATSPPPTPPSVASPASSAPPKSSSRGVGPASRKPPVSPSSPPKGTVSPPSSLKGKSLKAHWQEVLSLLRRKLSSEIPLYVDGLTRARLVEEVEGTVRLAFGREEAFRMETLKEDSHSRQMVERELRRLFDRPLRLEFFLLSEEEEGGPQLEVEVPPVVKKALDLFSGELIIQDSSKERT